MRLVEADDRDRGGPGTNVGDGTAGGGRTLSVDEAARRLGVRRQTIYAYVSRGLLERDPSSTRRATRFARPDVERLAGRARRTDRSPAVEAVVSTELTLLDPAGRLSYRGHDAIELARHAGFERTAALLWGGAAGEPWRAEPDAVDGVRQATAALPGVDAPVVLLPVVASVLRAHDQLRADRSPDAVRRVGRRIVAAFVDGAVGGDTGPVLDGVRRPGGVAARRVDPPRRAPTDDRIAARLWPVLAADGRVPSPAELHAVDAALVLLADHELAASTFAARVAASTWADPYAVVLAGLGPLGGSLHGNASAEVERLLDDACGPGGAARALGTRLGGGGPPAGFGHRVYRDRDPRADHLLSLLSGCGRHPARVRATAELVRIAAERGLPAPNVDLALAGICGALGLRAGAPATIFALARTVGLIAHGLEEYDHRLRFRPRATYVGELPPG